MTDPISLVEVHTYEQARAFLEARAGATVSRTALHLLCLQFPEHEDELAQLAKDLGIELVGEWGL